MPHLAATYAIYDPLLRQFRSNFSGEHWSTDLADAAFYRTEEAANRMITARRNKWARLKTEWRDHVNGPSARTTFEKWQRAFVREVRLETR